MPNARSTEKAHWPAVFYGPDGQDAVFNGPLEVPDGWHDHPRKFKTGEKTEIHGYDEAVAAAEGTELEDDEDDEDGEGGEDKNADGVDPDEPGQHNTGATDKDASIRETAEAKGYVLPDIKEITKDEIKKQLSARKVQFNSNWNEQRLYDLLKDNLDKSVDGVSKPVDEGNKL